MSHIYHFSIWDKTKKIKLAELSNQTSKDTYEEIKERMSSILNTDYPDKVEFKKYYLSFIITKSDILFLVVTAKKAGETLPERFLDQAICFLQEEINNNLNEKKNISDLCLQKQLNSTINQLMKSFDTNLNDSGLAFTGKIDDPLIHEPVNSKKKIIIICTVIIAILVIAGIVVFILKNKNII